MSDLKNHSRKAEAGISLIDLCIALILISVIMVPMVQQYRQYLSDREKNVNESAFTAVSIALNKYYFEHNRYPCPANPALGPSSANYGVEDTSNAICKSSPNGRVGYGAVPFVTLNLPVADTIDYRKRKLMYAVTWDMTQGGADGKSGEISIQYQNYNVATKVASLVTDETAAHYVLFSTGRDGVGGFSAEGTPIASCPTAVSREQQNCNGDHIFFGYHNGMTHAGDAVADRDISYNVIGSAETNADYYDDTLQFLNKQSSNIWQNPTDTVKDSAGMVEYLGINTEDPKVALDVNGAVRAQNGNIYAYKYCDQILPDDPPPGDPKIAGYNCFTATSIGGSSNEAIHCPEGQALAGIKDDGPICIAVVKVMKATSCSGNKVMIGIDAAGNAKCKAL